MKVTAVGFLFVFFIGISRAQNDESNKLATYFWQKCKNVTGDTKIFDKIYFEVGKLSEELGLAFQKLPDNKRVFCKENRHSLNNKFQSIASDLKHCLPQNEKYLSDFVKTSFSQFLHFLCHNDGEHVDRFFRQSAQQCRTVLVSNNEERVGKCFEKIFKPTGGYLSKTDVCDDLSTAKKCFDVILDEKCPSFQSYKHLNSELFRYISTPCSQDMQVRGASIKPHFSIGLLLATAFLSYISSSETW